MNIVKSDFIKTLKDFRQELINLELKCVKIKGNQIQSHKLLMEFELTATKWFDSIEPTLISMFTIKDEIIQNYRNPLGKILELSAGKTSKTVMLNIIRAILKFYQIDIIVPVQKTNLKLKIFPSLEVVLSHTVGKESDYLAEAIDCANSGKYRAAIILGWCAAINRMHQFIQKKGFIIFNTASVQMSNKQTGRYKRFNKKYEIHNLSDLRMSVFDKDLLWILEFLNAIDGNQHERLGICNTMRDNCSHPGEATISQENILSFFSDLDSFVFNNPKFTLDA